MWFKSQLYMCRLCVCVCVCMCVCVCVGPADHAAETSHELWLNFEIHFYSKQGIVVCTSTHIKTGIRRGM